MNILVACEESQRVCTELRKLGHTAFSCDIQECSGGHPEWHVQSDCLNFINGAGTTTDDFISLFETADGGLHELPEKWDMIIAFPPCTYLSNAATRSHSIKCNSIKNINERTFKRIEAMQFFMNFVNADCQRIAIENPVGVMNTAYRKPDQIIEPYYFAKDENDIENYVTKRTCLWLKGLPLLKHKDIAKPDNNILYGKYDNGKNKTWVDTTHSQTVRSKTFKGIAKAMAEQWAGQVNK